MTTYSNPRLEAVIENWPSGSYRVTATFSIESDPKRGERAVRTTIDPWTKKSKGAKKLTYAPKARIVDGDDGHTYLAMLTTYGFVSIMKGDMKFQHETVFADDPRHAELVALFH